MRKHILSLLLLLVFSVQGIMAKDYAYVYIEGDKQTPFYVKLEGQMMPRLGKNYCILPNMDAGVTNIEILFQQNQYPAQKFTIKVPEGGARGFLLKKVNERQFALYDMQQGFFLVSGNDVNDDRLEPAKATESPVITGTTAVVGTAAIPQADLPAFTPSSQSKTPKPKKTKDAVASTEVAPAGTSTDSKFIKDIELNTDGGSVIPAVAVPVVAVEERKTKKGRKITTDTASHIAAAESDEFEEDKKTPDATLVAAGIPNSDCKSPMSNEAFEDFATKILDQTTDDDKLKVLLKNKSKSCFSTEQVRIIANNFETQSGRYEVARTLFSRTSDQDSYPKLEALFKTNYLKNKFKEIMNPAK